MLGEVVREVRDGVKRVAQSSGGLRGFHRLRNKRRLTVLTFHRVLQRSDERWPDADKEWSLTVDELASCVEFVRDHYTVISLDQLLDARRRGAGLPEHPALLTFDDGWADNEEHALPVLEAAGVPAVIFVSGDAVGRHAPFWRESLRAAFLGGRLDDEIWRASWTGVGVAAPPRDPPHSNGCSTRCRSSRALGATRSSARGRLGSRTDAATCSRPSSCVVCETAV